MRLVKTVNFLCFHRKLLREFYFFFSIAKKTGQIYKPFVYFLSKYYHSIDCFMIFKLLYFNETKKADTKPFPPSPPYT